MAAAASAARLFVLEDLRAGDGSLQGQEWHVC